VPGRPPRSLVTRSEPSGVCDRSGLAGTAEGIHGSGRHLQAGDPAIVRPVAIK
jgi:hypothetical protein